MDEPKTGTFHLYKPVVDLPKRECKGKGYTSLDNEHLTPTSKQRNAN